MARKSLSLANANAPQPIGHQRILSHPNASPPHGHVNNPAGQRFTPNGDVVMTMTNSNIEGNRLHYATLIAVTAEWQSGEARVRVRLSQEPALVAEIVVAGSRLLRCPRAQPWGPSASINEVRILRLAEDRSRVEIEVQSGDVIEIDGERVELRLDA